MGTGSIIHTAPGTLGRLLLLVTYRLSSAPKGLPHVTLGLRGRVHRDSHARPVLWHWTQLSAAWHHGMRSARGAVSLWSEARCRRWPASLKAHVDAAESQMPMGSACGHPSLCRGKPFSGCTATAQSKLLLLWDRDGRILWPERERTGLTRHCSGHASCGRMAGKASAAQAGRL